MRSIIAHLWGLPSLEKRRMIGGRLKALLFNPEFSKEENDTYIYYLLFKRGLIACSLLSFLYFIALIFKIKIDLYLFTIALPETNFIEIFTKSFSFQASNILLFVLLPYHLILLGIHANPKKIDILKWNSHFRSLNLQNRKKILQQCFLCSFILLIALYGSFALPLMLAKYESYLHDSYAYFLFLLIFLSGAMSVIVAWLLFFLAVLWRYIGEYQGE